MLWLIIVIVVAAAIFIALKLPSDPENYKKCRFCNKSIKIESVKCRYCKKLLIEYPPEESS
ncbi:MAG: hypothetical protein AB7J13_08180 [Pyrinomonadaceae bacterium]